jgi:hypothetical protein
MSLLMTLEHNTYNPTYNPYILEIIVYTTLPYLRWGLPNFLPGLEQLFS